jgi:aspartate/methionine/tyrosine aminotransferase
MASLSKVHHSTSRFFYFLRLPGIFDDAQFSRQLFEERKVAVVPGSAFGMRPDSGYFRLTFVSEEPGKIDMGVQRIARHIEGTPETPRLSGPDY